MHEKKTIGIVGDGQLGRMMAEVAIPMGHQVAVLGMAGPNSPAAQVGARQIEGALTDPDALRRLAAVADVMTIEIEHTHAPTLIGLAEEGYDVQPSPHSLHTIQDKLLQKRHVAVYGLPVAPFQQLSTELDLQQARQEMGDRLIAKTRTGGYDGRGNLVIRDGQSLAEVQRALGSDNLYVEKIVDFKRELAVVGARDRLGRVAIYPVVETIHIDHICHIVKAPAEIEPHVREQAERYALRTIDSFSGAGVFAVEMFQNQRDQVLVNEVAPRVHNSGHFTIEGAETSQFKQHILAITGQELGSTQLTSPAAVMINIIGSREGEFNTDELLDIAADNIFPHWYGKSLRPKRKVGHITVLAATMAEAVELAEAARAQLSA